MRKNNNFYVFMDQTKLRNAVKCIRDIRYGVNMIAYRLMYDH